MRSWILFLSLVCCGTDQFVSADGAADASSDAPMDANGYGCMSSNGWAMTPNIYACPAAWRVPGVINIVARNAQCVLATGDNCSVADACAVGWHVCTGDADATMHGMTRMICFSADAQSRQFFTTREHGLGACIGMPNNDDVVGCGSFGSNVMSMCMNLPRSLTSMDSDTVWDLGTDFFNETNNVRKLAREEGGVLCCSGAM